MKKILFLVAAIIISTTPFVFAQPSGEDLEQELQEYYNDLFESSEQKAQEIEYELRNSTDPNIIRSQLEKAKFSLYNLNRANIPEAQKAEKRKDYKDAIKYYEYRLYKMGIDN